jgi:hypothetical protein
MLAVVLNIIGKVKAGKLGELKLSDIEVKFSRNRTDSLLVKTQGLMNQLQAGIHPLIAISNCGLYSDPQSVWNDSRPYLGKWIYEEEEDEVQNIKHSGGEDNYKNTQEVSPK